MNLQERIKELELRYKRYLFKKYALYFTAFLIFLSLPFFIYKMYEKNEKQKILSLKLMEEKKHLEQRLLEAKLNQEKNKILKTKNQEQNLTLVPKEEDKIQIHAKTLDINLLKKAFYKNPSYEKALLLARMYFENKIFKKSIFWSLKANELKKDSKEAWLLFIKAKEALGEDEEAKRAMNFYNQYYNLMELED